MKPFTLALVAIISCALGVSARAATLETSAGKPVPEGQVSAELIRAVADFEKNSVFVVDGASDNIIDVFVREDFYSLLGYETNFFSIFSNSRNVIETKSVSFPVCSVVVVTRLEVDAKTGVLSCDAALLSPEVKAFASLRWMARVEKYSDEFSSLEVNGSSGVIYLTLDSKNYVLRFKVTAQEMVVRRNALVDLRRLIEEERLAVEEERLANARAEAERLKRRTEEATRRGEAQLKTIVSQAIVLDGVLALPVKSVTEFVGWSARTQEDGCIVSEVRLFSSTVCNEIAWMRTNYVPLRISDKLYVPIPVYNTIFSHVEFRHDAPSRMLNVRLTNEEKLVLTFKFTLPSSLPTHRTVTQRRIFAFSEYSAPKCSTVTVVRPTYAVTITVGDNDEFSYFMLKLSNTSNTPINIIWDETLLRLANGQRSAVMQGLSEASTRPKAQPPTTVAPRTADVFLLYPAAVKVEALGRLSNFTNYAKLFDIAVESDWERDSLVVTGATATVSGVLAVRVGGKKVFENFSVTCTTKPGEYRR